MKLLRGWLSLRVVVRILGTAGIIAGVYFEAGPFTAAACFLMAFDSEARAYMAKRLERHLAARDVVLDRLRSAF